MSNWYAVGRGGQKTAAGESWSHGSATSKAFDRFDMSKDHEGQDEDQPKHWNSHLGSHFTSEHETAADLANDNGGHVYHVDLAAKNPKHYDSEFDLDGEAHRWAG